MIHLAIRMNGYMTYTSVSLKNTWRWKERKHWWNKFITEENKNERLGGKKGERHWKIKGTRTEIKYMQDNTNTHELAAYVKPQILLLLDDRFTSSKYHLLGLISAVMPWGYYAWPALLEFLPENGHSLYFTLLRPCGLF